MSWTDSTTPPPAAMDETYCWRRGSWEAYWRTQRHHRTPGRVKEDQGAYLPNPDEVESRIADMQWLVEHGFPDEVITAIMVEDCPALWRVRQLVRRHGAAAAVARCLRFWKGECDGG
jgi:hypothetical protein